MNQTKTDLQIFKQSDTNLLIMSTHAGPAESNQGVMMLEVAVCLVFSVLKNMVEKESREQVLGEFIDSVKLNLDHLTDYQGPLHFGDS